MNITGIMKTVVLECPRQLILTRQKIPVNYWYCSVNTIVKVSF